MSRLRGALFLVWLYAMIVLVGLGGSPWLAASRRTVWKVVRAWVGLTLWGLRWIAGVRMEVRGGAN
ncbi:MAG: lysophospholipid acyltransferase family protein, partial [Caulobacteraceae bacterium]